MDTELIIPYLTTWALFIIFLVIFCLIALIRFIYKLFSNSVMRSVNRSGGNACVDTLPSGGPDAATESATSKNGENHDR